MVSCYEGVHHGVVQPAAPFQLRSLAVPGQWLDTAGGRAMFQTPELRGIRDRALRRA